VHLKASLTKRQQSRANKLLASPSSCGVGGWVCYQPPKPVKNFQTTRACEKVDVCACVLASMHSEPASSDPTTTLKLSRASPSTTQCSPKQVPAFATNAKARGVCSPCLFVACSTCKHQKQGLQIPEPLIRVRGWPLAREGGGVMWNHDGAV